MGKYLDILKGAQKPPTLTDIEFITRWRNASKALVRDVELFAGERDVAKEEIRWLQEQCPEMHIALQFAGRLKPQNRA